MKYEYRGSVFEVDTFSRTASNCWITGVLEHGDVLSVPETIDGKSVTSFSYSDNGWGSNKSALKGVKKLIIPETIDRLTLSNYVFSDLEELVISEKNKKYSTDGKMLFSKDGTKLILALCNAMKSDTVVVPEHVVEVDDYAFTKAKCKKIEFANRNVIIKGNPFESSAWYKSLVDANKPVYVGNMLFRAPKAEELIVEPYLTRYHVYAFSDNKPQKLVTPVVPSAIREFTSRYENSPKRLVITSEKKVNIRPLKDWRDLEDVTFINNRYYKSIDGVVFSKDGKTLLIYPMSKTEKEYVIPDGVKCIEKGAFREQKHLEKLHIHSGVTQISQGAFYGCRSLKSVVMETGISVIADATVFQPQGVFENCISLESVDLPQKLTHIGAKAFCGCKNLRRITIPEGVRWIGEYAFYETDMDSIRLPKSLLHISDGALMTGDYNSNLDVYAYEGSARGLIPAIEGVENGSLRKTSNLIWRPASIHILKGNGLESDVIPLPKSLKHSAGAYIDSAWNQSRFSYDDYYSIFTDIQDSEEKIKFAMHMVSKAGSVSDSEYEQYLRRTSSKIASGLVEQKDEEGLISFIRKGYVSANSLKNLLAKCNKADMTTASAYILQSMNKNKKKGASVIRL